ncbi:LysR family transcriptional regulator [Methylobacterium sp. Leaf123]|uniref:LysR family transcriptional regulator n=1 Tax=Methylobacterium sp. Leaf123 TaxID=1736264 RepID=UPI0006F58BE6|nr:LysR substrate-binding domain-containing protein [Methylobacterium sp. Leaf123]KQQ23553.1 LysR family transcriptional regulator [Methylobacterium sp. Leaf123]
MSALNPSNLDLDLVRTFVTICEAGTFVRAAERVGRTPSAISLQVKRLEERLGRALFLRQPRAVVPTADGEALLGLGRRLLALNDEVVAFFDAPPMEGRVRFGAPNDSGLFALPAMLRRFAATHPQVEVDVRLDASRLLVEALAEGELDLVLYAGHLPSNRAAQVVHSEDLVWIGLRGGLAEARRPLPLALCQSGCTWRAAALDALDQAGIPYRVAYTSEHCQGQIAAVEADLAVAPLPLSVARPPFQRIGALPPLGSYDVLMRPRDGAGPAARALAGHVADSFRDLPGLGNRLFA